MFNIVLTISFITYLEMIFVSPSVMVETPSPSGEEKYSTVQKKRYIGTSPV
jgi:hypothetical protein